MNDCITSTLDMLIEALRFQKRCSERSLKVWEAGLERISASRAYSEGLFRYMNEFMTPFWISLDSFMGLERKVSAGQMH